jgi:nicotinamide-nucleotide amidase
MNAQIITIGDELLIGQVVDTNSAWLGEKLTEAGIKVSKILSIQDEDSEIVQHLQTACKEADIVILSGGLGPTKDDITKASIARFLNREMHFNQDVYDGIEAYLERHGRKPGESIKYQCFFPTDTIFLQNNMGTAPGMVFKQGTTTIISVPGVPYEMKYIMENEGLPLLKAMNTSEHILQKTILTAGVFEAMLSDRLSDIIDNFPDFLSIAFLPNLNQVRLRLTVRGKDKELLQKELDFQSFKIIERLGNQVFGFGKITLAESLGALLIKRNLMLSTAESCTGGYLAHLITSNAGSSDYYNGSIISYSNELKMNILGVHADTLEKHGAVSEPTVTEMVRGALLTTGSDVAISISGIAGPGGGSEEKPVGTIWMAVGNKNKVVTKTIKLSKDRIKNIQSAAIHALDLARLFILEEY